MFNVNVHSMLTLTPPHGTQIVQSHDGSFMIIFAKTDRDMIVGVIKGWLKEVEGLPAVAGKVQLVSVTPNAAPVRKGEVIKGDAEFPMVPTEKLDETTHVDIDVAEHMQAANKRGQHDGDTERPPPTEPHNEVPSLEV
jgi:hypothetical protein